MIFFTLSIAHNAEKVSIEVGILILNQMIRYDKIKCGKHKEFPE